MTDPLPVTDVRYEVRPIRAFSSRWVVDFYGRNPAGEEIPLTLEAVTDRVFPAREAADSAASRALASGEGFALATSARPVAVVRRAERLTLVTVFWYEDYDDGFEPVDKPVLLLRPEDVARWRDRHTRPAADPFDGDVLRPEWVAAWVADTDLTRGGDPPPEPFYVTYTELPVWEGGGA